MLWMGVMCLSGLSVSSFNVFSVVYLSAALCPIHGSDIYTQYKTLASVNMVTPNMIIHEC